MNIAFVTIGLSDNVSAWSGIPYFMSEGFAGNGANVARIQGLRGISSGALRLQEFLRRRILRENYSTYRHKKRMLHYAAQVDEIVRKTRPDVIVSPSTLPLAYLKSDIPAVVWTDATFHSLLDFYPEYRGLSARAIAEGDATEKAALERCTLALYASEWAARSAVSHYGAKPDKVRVIPMGANLAASDDEQQVASSVASRPMDRCELLLIGVDWERKGCRIAVDAAVELNRRGLPTTLTIVGCTPPADQVVPECVNIVGFVDKRSEEGMERVRSLLRNSHFLILPSRAECYGIVFAEANSFGVPVLTSKVGGTPSAVNEGTSGFLVEMQSPMAEVNDYCDAILQTMSYPETYRRLGMSAFEEFRSKLNWKVATATAMDAIAAQIGA